jgi:transposase
MGSFSAVEHDAPMDARAMSLLQEKDATIADLQSQMTALKRRIEWFERQLFGSRSERIVQPAAQLHLGEVFGGVEPPDVERKKTIAAYERRMAQKDTADANEGAPFFDASRVPVEVIELPASEQANLKADEYEIISHKETCKLAQRPGSYVILKYVRPVIKIKATEELRCAAAPVGVIEGSRADVSFAAGLVVNKCAYHLPLYRQHVQLKDQGIDVSRQWLTQIIQKVLELCRPLYDAQLTSIRASRVITMDETSIKAGRMEGKTPLGSPRRGMKSGYFWPVMGDQDEVCFPFFPTRSKHCVEGVLGLTAKPDAVLLTDGYAVYESYAKKAGITHAQCWVHARRQFFDAQDADPERAAIALTHIRQLFSVEDDIAALTLKGENKRHHRLTHSKPIVERFYAWIDEHFARHGLLPSDPVVQAMGYAKDHRVALEVFLTDPDVPLDTNHIERTLRVIPMGKKNWMFCWTELGAEHIGIAQSLIATCRMHGIDPYTYLVDVLQRICQHPQSRVAELTPRRWKELFADNPMRSDVYTVGNSTRKDAT